MFLSLELNLTERFYPKTRYRQTLSEQKNTDKENRHRGNNRKIHLDAQIFVKLAFCMISKVSNLPQKHRNDISKVTTVKFKLS